MLSDVRDEVAAELQRVLDEHGYDVDGGRLELNLQDAGKGDIASPVAFEAAQQSYEDARTVAESVAADQELVDGVASVSVDGPGYINYYLDTDRFMVETVNQILDDGERYGQADGDRTAVMDVSSPNVAKLQHPGHVRNTDLGLAIENILEARGTDVVTDNHLGDWGSQFGNLLYAYHTYEESPGHDMFTENPVEHRFEDAPVEHLLELYQAFGQYEKSLDSEAKVEALRDAGRAWFRKLQEGDDEATQLWRQFRDVSIDRFSDTYDMMGAEFDMWIGESFYVLNGYTDQLLEKAFDMGVAREKEDGSVVIPVTGPDGDEEEFMLLKSDGTTLYGTRDLATIDYREKVFHADEYLYVVASEQDTYFQQLFEAADRLGYDSSKLHHISYGLISLPEGSMSTRDGTMIAARDVFDAAEQAAYDIVADNNSILDEEQRQEVARQVAQGAIRFQNLKVSREKNITFDLEEALDFEGDTGPYLQYAGIRANSILDEVEAVPAMPTDPVYNEADEALVKTISLYPLRLAEAAEDYEPASMATYLLDVAHEFNRFYHRNRVLDADNEEERVAITAATAQILENGTDLLNFDIPDYM